jgi:serine/threonine protein kinase
MKTKLAVSFFLFPFISPIFSLVFDTVIVMELCESGDLESLIRKNVKEGKKFSEEVFLFYSSLILLICIGIVHKRKLRML